MRILRKTSWLILVMLLAGCGKPAGVIFEPLPEPLVWPPAPDTPRIRYVGQLATSADLKPGVNPAEALGEAIFGKQPVRSMLTPYAVCTDNADRVFVADSNAQVVHVFNLKTRKYQQWRPPEKTPQFAQPVGLAWDPAGRLFVADSIGGRILVFDTNGKFTGNFGTQLVDRPCGLAYDAPHRRLFVADAGAHRIAVFSETGSVIARLGERGIGLGQFNFPTNVALDAAGNLYVSDSLNFRIQQLGADFKPIAQIGKKGDVPGTFGQPKGIATDSQNHLYVVDAHFEAVQLFNSQGTLLMDFGKEGTGPGQFWIPAGIFIDRNNRIWIADSYNRRVQVFDFLPEAQP